MSDFPFQVLAVPIIGFLIVGYMIWQRKTVGAQHDAQFSNFRAGELAQRLQMQLVEGDPAFNFFIRYANVDVIRGPSDGRPVHVAVRMQGAPYGVPLELRYYYRVEQKTELTQVTWTTWFDCSMTAYPKQPFPPFEVLSRNAPVGPIVQKNTLPAMRTGDPSVDAIYQVSTQEPAMAQVLGQVLPGFATFANSGIHLVGDGQTVSFVMKQDKAPLLANALYYAEQMAQQLSEVARKVGG